MFDYQKNSRLRFSFYLTVLILTFLIGGAHAQPRTETIRNAALTPEKLSASFAEVARSVEPAVVNIDTKGKVPDFSIKDDNLPNNKNNNEGLIASSSGWRAIRGQRVKEGRANGF